MDPESKKLLQDTLKLVEDNNRMLHSMKRSMRVQRFVTYVYWAFLIVTALGAYYFIQPYLEQLIGVYGSSSDILNNFKQFSE